MLLSEYFLDVLNDTGPGWKDRYFKENVYCHKLKLKSVEIKMLISFSYKFTMSKILALGLTSKFLKKL